MEDEGVLIGLEAADDGVDGAVTLPENLLRLPLDGAGVGDRRGLVTVETRTAAPGIPARPCPGSRS